MAALANRLIQYNGYICKMKRGICPHSNAMCFLSFPEASLHYLHTFDTIRKFKYHILEFPMTNTLTIESCIMKWEGGHMPPIPYHLGAFESSSISNTNQHYLEAIPSKFHVYHNNKQDTGIVCCFGQKL